MLVPLFDLSEQVHLVVFTLLHQLLRLIPVFLGQGFQLSKLTLGVSLLFGSDLLQQRLLVCDLLHLELFSLSCEVLQMLVLGVEHVSVSLSALFELSLKPVV